MFCIQGTCENQNPVVDNTIPLKCISSNQCPSFLTFFSGILHISSHLIPSHPISSHLIPSHPISSHLIPSHPISSHLICLIHSFPDLHETNLTPTHMLSYAVHASPSAGHPQCCNLAFHREDKFCAFQELKVHSSTDQPTDKSWDCLVECKDLNFPRHQHHLPETKWFGSKKKTSKHDGGYKSE